MPETMSRAGVDPERWITRTIVFLLSVEILILILDVIFNFLAVIDDQDVQEIFNVAREMSINNWFSSMQEAAVGLVLWLIYLKVKTAPGPVGPTRGWAAVSIFFFYIGLDDGVTIHERVSTAIENFYAITPQTTEASGAAVGWFGSLLSRFPSYAWQVVFGPGFALMGLFLVWFLWRQLERKQALIAFFGLFLYAAAQGQDFIEGMETPYDWMTAKLGTEPYTVPHFMKMGEEYLEMLGTTVLLYVVLRHYARLSRRRAG